MRLSIVVPTLNEEAHIESLLDDLAPLRVAGHEVILVDGGSEDATLELATSGVDQVVRGRRGRAAQMNAGTLAASGDILWFLHADTRVPPKAAEALLTACIRGARWGRFDVRLSGRQPLLRVVERMMNWRSQLTGIATGDQGIFVARDAFESVGGYPDVPLMEDIEISKALCRLARPVCLRPSLVTSSRRWETYGVVRTIVLMWWLRLAHALGVRTDRLARWYNS